MNASDCVVRAMVAAFNARDLAGVLRHYAMNYTGVDLSLGVQHQNREALAHALRSSLRAFPDVAITLHQVTCWPRQTVVAWSLEGTHRGAFMHIPATGRRITAVGTSFYRLTDAGITQAMHLWDVAGLLRAMRLLPEWPRGHRMNQAEAIQNFFVHGFIPAGLGGSGMDAKLLRSPP